MLKSYQRLKDTFDAQFRDRDKKLTQAEFQSLNDQKEFEKVMYAPMLAQFYQDEYDKSKWNLDQLFDADILSKKLSLYLLTVRRFFLHANDIDSEWDTVQQEVREMVSKFMDTGKGLAPDQKLNAQLNALDNYYSSITRDYHLKLLGRIFRKQKLSKI